jgi:hypothetical protein
MDATDVILCGLVWAQFRQREAGLELVRAIESADPEPQSWAEVMLEQAGLCSEELVKDAIAKDSYATLETRLLSFQPSDTAQGASAIGGCPPTSD